MVRVFLFVIIFLIVTANVTQEKTIDECGRIYYFRNECWVFQPFSGKQACLLRNSGGFSNHDIVRIQGNWEYCYVFCSGVHFYACMSNLLITLCASESLGCGVLREIVTPGCEEYWLWESFEWGRLKLWNCSFEDGDLVHALGYIDRSCGNYCIDAEGCLVEPSLNFCDTPVSIFQETWGQLKNLYR